MLKFNNSLAIQNVGTAGLVSSVVNPSHGGTKSRNGPYNVGMSNNGLSFKTAASIASNKTNEHLKVSVNGRPGMLSSEKKHIKSNKQSLVAGNEGNSSKKQSKPTTAHAKQLSGSRVGNTNSNLYSMIY